MQTNSVSARAYFRTMSRELADLAQHHELKTLAYLYRQAEIEAAILDEQKRFDPPNARRRPPKR